MEPSWQIIVTGSGLQEPLTYIPTVMAVKNVYTYIYIAKRPLGNKIIPFLLRTASSLAQYLVQTGLQ